MLLALPYKKKGKKKKGSISNMLTMKGQSLSGKKKEREAKKAILAFNVCKGHRENMTNDEKYSLTSKTATAARR